MSAEAQASELSVEETVALLRAHAFQEHGDDYETAEVPTGRTLIHSRLGGIGADWDLDDAIALAERAQWRGWMDSLLGHNLGIETYDGDRVRLYAFAVRRPEPAVDTRNEFLVGVHGDDLVLGLPIRGRLTKDEALRLAAWLSVLADPLDKRFPMVREAIENT